MSTNCTYKFHTRDGQVTIKGMAEMKAFLATNGVGAIIRPPSKVKATARAAIEASAPAQARMSTERAPAFYSQLQRAIERVPARLSTMSAPQWAQWLKANASKLGVKQDEVTWSGIDDYLKLRGRDKIDSGELAAWVGANGVRVEDVLIGGPLSPNAVAQIIRDNDNLGFDSVNQAYNAIKADYRRDPSSLDVWDISEADRFAIRRALDADQRPTKYGDYTVPGSTKYRELLLTLPTREPRGLNQIAQSMYGKQFGDLDDDEANSVTRAEREEKKAGNYKSSHWDQRNILAHVRVDERTDADGKRVLFVNEVQSDSGQDRRKGKTNWQAPFITKTEGWLNLALKRIAMLAVEGGYDKVAFISGKQATDLYQLSNQIDRIDYNRNGDGTYNLSAIKDRREVFVKEDVPEVELEDIVGREIAQKMVGGEGRRREEFDEVDRLESDDDEAGDFDYGATRPKTLSGLDIEVGGDGMKGFYDQIVPQAISKLLPKLGGGKLTAVSIPDGNAGREVVAAEIPGERMWGVYDRQKGRWLSSWDAETYATDPEDAEMMGESAAKSIASVIMRDAGVMLEQAGFEVTDKMRDTVLSGVPLFSRERAGTDAEADADQTQDKYNQRIEALRELVACLSK